MAATYETLSLTFNEYNAIDDIAAWVQAQGFRLLSVQMDAAHMQAVIVVAKDDA